jgi:hypothetical protein
VEGPVEPGQHRLDVRGLDRAAAPDPQTRRRVAIGADVQRHAFGLQPLGHRLGEGRAIGDARSVNFRQTEVFDRVAGSDREVVDPVRSSQKSKTACALAVARAISPGSPPIDCAQSSASR